MTWAWSHAIVLSVVLVASGCSSDDASTGPDSQATTPVQSQADMAITTASSVTTAPTGPPGFTAVAEALDRARLRWSDAGSGSYQLTVTEHRNFWSRGCTWTSVVTDGVVTETDTRPRSSARIECSDEEWTVERLHGMVARMLDDVDEFAAPEFGEHTLEVSFNENGVPEAIEFDLANGADEEASMQVTFAEPP